ncbi:hypothetical protein, partial [Burkholderia cenocepacia]|uniref:hypothetical protein n=1 Tax=Burkholderia cenocepacia TaxID=95486 RepID=UPI0011CFAF9B
MTLTYPDNTGNGLAAAPAHPIFNGPYTPVGTSWTGSSFAHGTVSGSGLTALITNSVNGRIVLATKTVGTG